MNSQYQENLNFQADLENASYILDGTNTGQCFPPDLREHVVSFLNEYTHTETNESDFNEAGWSRVDMTPAIEPFLGEPGIKIFPKNPEDIIDVTSLFISDDLFQLITTESNTYHFQNSDKFKTNSRSKLWDDITLKDMKKFFALNFLMSQVRKDGLSDYWSTDTLIETPYFAKVMSRNRFRQIMQTLHFSNNDDLQENASGLQKIQGVLTDISDKFNTVYKPKQILSLSEAMIPYRGNFSFLDFDPNEMERHGILFRMLCEADTGYICNFQLLCGVGDVKRNSVVGLLNDKENLWHHVYLENYYTDVRLAKKLLNKKFRMCGSIKDSKKIPRELINNFYKRGDSDFRRKGDILIQVFQESEVFRIVSTIHNANMIEIGKPNRKTGEVVKRPDCVVNYTHHLKNLKSNNQHLLLYSILQKSAKWTNRLVFFALNCALFNAYVLFKELNKENKIGFDRFIHAVIKGWIEPDIEENDTNVAKDCTQTNSNKEKERPGVSSKPVRKTPKRAPYKKDPPGRLSGDMRQHCLEKIKATGTKKFPQRRCRVCNANNRRRETSFICKSCQVPLCRLDCFQQYHTMKKY